MQGGGFETRPYTFAWILWYRGTSGILNAVDDERRVIGEGVVPVTQDVVDVFCGPLIIVIVFRVGVEGGIIACVPANGNVCSSYRIPEVRFILSI